MEKALYYLLYGLLKGIALLPFTVLYGIADVLYFLIYHVGSYRKGVVRKNLRESFPEKSEEELKSIERQFYRNFADYVVETIKLLHISDAQMVKRMVFENLDVMDSLTEEGRSIAIYFSHCGNWEWAPSVTLHMAHLVKGTDVEFGQVYRPLRNRVFDKLMLKVRSRFGSHSFAKNDVFRQLYYLKREGKVTLTGFMSDQKPSHGDPTEVVMFLNHPTAMITGTERLARQLHMGAIYWDMHKPKRGHYIIRCRTISRDVSAEEQGRVTRSYAAMLEETIRRNPSIWLWTHKRWKIPVQFPG